MVGRTLLWLRLYGLPTVHLWVVGLLKGFAEAKRFTALVRVTDEGISKVWECLMLMYMPVEGVSKAWECLVDVYACFMRYGVTARNGVFCGECRVGVRSS